MNGIKCSRTSRSICNGNDNVSLNVHHNMIALCSFGYFHLLKGRHCIYRVYIMICEFTLTGFILLFYYIFYSRNVNLDQMNSLHLQMGVAFCNHPVMIPVSLLSWTFVTFLCGFLVICTYDERSYFAQKCYLGLAAHCRV